MLANLTVQDIVLIDRLGVEFDAGLTVLTGETGAGKSILLDAMALALGGRGDNALVRPDAERGQVIAEFEPDADHPVRALLSENGIETDGPVILRRVQSADGKTRAFVNDQPVSAGLLRAAGASLVEIHGQHDERALVDPGEHRRLLDAFGGLEPDAAEVVRFQAAWRAAEHDAAALKGSIAEAERERDFLEAAVSELEALSPETGEEQRLADQRQMLMQAEKIAGDLGEAYETIAGSPSPVPEFSSLLRRLDRKAAEAPGLLDGVVAGLGAALDNLEEVRLGLEAALRTANFDPHELEAAEERLFALRAAAPTHRTDVDGLPEVAVEISARLADLETGRERLAGLEKAVRETQARYRQAARRLSAKRETTARTLEAEVNNELPALKLETATFFVVQDEGCFGRRTFALPAGAQGGARRPWFGPDFGFRRDRYRGGRGRRRSHRPASGAAGGARAGARRHPRAASRGTGRRASADSQKRGGQRQARCDGRHAGRGNGAARGDCPHAGRRRHFR
jgi:DNA repair protein RecN (Recombination protein N)